MIPFPAVPERLLRVLAAVALLSIVGTVYSAVAGPTDTPPFWVEPAASDEAYPEVHALRSWAGEELTSAIEPGDEVVAIGDRDLAGVGTVAIRVAYHAGFDEELGGVPIVLRRDGTEHDVLSPVNPELAFVPIGRLLMIGLFFLLGTFVTLRSPRGTLGRSRMLLCLWCLAIGFGEGLSAPAPEWLAWGNVWWDALVRQFLVWFGYLTLLAAIDAAALRRPIVHLAFLLPGAVMAATIPMEYFGPATPAVETAGLVATDLAFYAGFILIPINTYRQASQLGRRRLRWVIPGLVMTAALAFTGMVAAAGGPAANALVFYGFRVLAIAAFATGVVMAVTRAQLFDVDRVLGATATYVTLGFSAIVGVLLLVPRAATGIADATGVDDGTAYVALSIVIAAAAMGIRRPVRRTIDRLLFRERERLREAFDDLSATLTESDDLGDADAVLITTGHRLVDALAPDSLVVYARVEGTLTPILAHGTSAAVDLPADGPMASRLAGSSRAVPLDGADTAPRGASEFEIAVLEDLAAKVVVPVSQAGELNALLVIGAKGSGDVYVSEDHSNLTGIGRTLAAVLRKLDDDAVRLRANRVQEELHRYVPAAVADRIARGQSVSSQSMDVTVLFVDIRGYTAYSESRSPDENFAMISTYTETASTIIRDHSGHVIEFHGDGLLAIFGAPEPDDDKESAAIAAARALVPAVRAIEISGDATLDLGVGIATGPAHVGNIRSADRTVWNVIGNTPNLAARLQDETKALGCHVVIDTTTANRADPRVVDDFSRVDHVVIRGRTDPQTVYFLRVPVTQRVATVGQELA